MCCVIQCEFITHVTALLSSISAGTTSLVSRITCVHARVSLEHLAELDFLLSVRALPDPHGNDGVCLAGLDRARRPHHRRHSQCCFEGSTHARTDDGRVGVNSVICTTSSSIIWCSILAWTCCIRGEYVNICCGTLGVRLIRDSCFMRAILFFCSISAGTATKGWCILHIFSI